MLVLGKFDNLTATRAINYSLDGKPSVSITNINYSYIEDEQASIVRATTILSEIANGPHKLLVEAKYDYTVYIYPDIPRPDDTYVIQSHKSKASVWFTLDATEPIITNQPSPTNNTKPTIKGVPAESNPNLPYIIATIIMTVAFLAILEIYHRRSNNKKQISWLT